MVARYLLRFDDLCPTMNWAVWDRIEDDLIRLGISPIVAVVPDNRDPFLEIDPPNDGFWERVRTWQSRGWTIAMHGCHHAPVTSSSGLIGINQASEFAGLPEHAQRSTLERGLRIFKKEGVNPTVWVAPHHSFDQTTVHLLDEAGIGVISDGLQLFPRRDEKGRWWVPHQLWHFRPLPFGVWTVGVHHNRWTDRELRSFLSDLARYAETITTLDKALGEVDRSFIAMLDSLVPPLYLALIRLRRKAREMGLMRLPTNDY